MLYIAAILAFAVGCAHSWLGERRIIAPLVRRGRLPRIRNSEKTTATTIRVAWHVTTLLFWAFGIILVLMARDALNMQNVAAVAAGLFLPMGLIALVASRGRHLSWLPFLLIGGICLHTAIA